MRAALVGLALALAVTRAHAAESPIAFWTHHGAPVARGAPAIAAGDLASVARRFLGRGNFTGTRGPWCADAVSAWLRMTGRRPLPGRMAADALRYGPRLSWPSVGALAVLSGRRGWASHVGVVEAVDGERVTMLSGNWSHKVSRAVLPRRAFAAFIGV